MVMVWFALICDSDTKLKVVVTLDMFLMLTKFNPHEAAFRKAILSKGEIHPITEHDKHECEIGKSTWDKVRVMGAVI